MFDFSKDEYRKIFNQKFWNFFRGVPPFWPREVRHLQKWPSHHYLWPNFFIAESLKNVDVCKKLEFNPLRFDRDMRGLIKKKIISNFFHFLTRQTKSTVNLWVFKIFPISFFYMARNLQLILVITRIQNPGWKRGNKLIIFALLEP